MMIKAKYHRTIKFTLKATSKATSNFPGGIPLTPAGDLCYKEAQSSLLFSSPLPPLYNSVELDACVLGEEVLTKSVCPDIFYMYILTTPLLGPTVVQISLICRLSPRPDEN